MFTELASLEVVDGGLLQIFQSFGTAQQGRCTTGENALHELRRTAEGGRTFGGIQHTKTA